MRETRHAVQASVGYRYSFVVFAFFLCAQQNVANGAMAAADYFSSAQEVALAEAAEKGDVKVLERLRSSGADLNAVGRDGMTPAFWAIIHISKAGFGYLVEHGANPNATYAGRGNDSPFPGSSATSLAAMAEDSWYLKEVLAHGGDPNYVNPLSRRTPLLNAILATRDQNVKILIAGGANLNALDRDGFTPAIVATGIWRFDYVYELLVAGADPHIRTANGRSLALWVKRSRIPPVNPRYAWKLKVVELLKEKDVDVESATQ